MLISHLYSVHMSIILVTFLVVTTESGIVTPLPRVSQSRDVWCSTWPTCRALLITMSASCGTLLSLTVKLHSKAIQLDGTEMIKLSKWALPVMRILLKSLTMYFIINFRLGWRDILWSVHSIISKPSSIMFNIFNRKIFSCVSNILSRPVKNIFHIEELTWQSRLKGCRGSFYKGLEIL